MGEVENELSRPVAVGELPPEGERVEIVAEPGECEALAKRLGIVGLTSLTAVLVVAPAAIGEGAVRVTGEFRAHIAERCVVSLDVFETDITEPVEALFVRGAESLDHADEAFDAEDEVIEPLEGETIDAGELVVEHLAVALDPYPRGPGVPAEAVTYSVGPDGARAEIETEKGPFAALGELRRKM